MWRNTHSWGSRRAGRGDRTRSSWERSTVSEVTESTEGGAQDRGGQEAPKERAREETQGQGKDGRSCSGVTEAAPEGGFPSFRPFPLG